MKVVKVQSDRHPAMYTWAIVDTLGSHTIRRGADERLHADDLDMSHEELRQVVIKARRQDRKNKARRERDQAMRDIGMVKVRGALGGVYWE